MRQRKEVVIDLSGGRSFINKPNTERYTGNDKERKKVVVCYLRWCTVFCPTGQLRHPYLRV